MCDDVVFLTQRDVSLIEQAMRSGAIEVDGDYVCPTICDDDCESLCHECHDVGFKQKHDVDECWARVQASR